MGVRIMSKIVIPGPPVGKGRPRMTKSGHVYTPKETHEYEARVKSAYLTQCGEPPISAGHPVSIGLLAYFPLNKGDSIQRRKAKLLGHEMPTKKADLDNILKVCMDGLNGLAYEDDCQVTFTTAAKLYDEEPRVEISMIELIPPAQDDDGRAGDLS